MTTAEKEQLYIAHAEDFRALLNRSAMVRVGTRLINYIGNAWWYIEGETTPRTLPTDIAVAAMTEAWRERLEADGVRFYQEGETGYEDWYFMRSNHVTPSETYNSLPEAICAAVKVLAAEKRAESKAEKPKCERCHGDGWLRRDEIDPDGYHEEAMRGFSDDTQYDCPDCDGTGVAAEKADHIPDATKKVEPTANFHPEPQPELIPVSVLKERERTDHIAHARKKVSPNPLKSVAVGTNATGADACYSQPTLESLAKRVEEQDARFRAFLKYARETVSTWPKWKQEVFGKTGAD